MTASRVAYSPSATRAYKGLEDAIRDDYDPFFVARCADAESVSTVTSVNYGREHAYNLQSTVHRSGSDGTNWHLHHQNRMDHQIVLLVNLVPICPRVSFHLEMLLLLVVLMVRMVVVEVLVPSDRYELR